MKRWGQALVAALALANVSARGQQADGLAPEAEALKLLVDQVVQRGDAIARGSPYGVGQGVSLLAATLAPGDSVSYPVVLAEGKTLFPLAQSATGDEWLTLEVLDAKKRAVARAESVAGLASTSHIAVDPNKDAPKPKYEEKLSVKLTLEPKASGPALCVLLVLRHQTGATSPLPFTKLVPALARAVEANKAPWPRATGRWAFAMGLVGPNATATYWDQSLGTTRRMVAVGASGRFVASVVDKNAKDLIKSGPGDAADLKAVHQSTAGWRVRQVEGKALTPFAMALMEGVER